MKPGYCNLKVSHPPLLRLLVGLFIVLTQTLAVAIPAAAVSYLWFFQDHSLRYENHVFHIFAISIACGLSGFVAFVAWRCWLMSGEPFLRFITLALLGFTVIYLPHGFLTPLAHHNMWLFLLYGPFSRLVMGAYMLAALYRYDEGTGARESRITPGLWRRHIVFMMLMAVVVVPAVAFSPLASVFLLRLVAEGLAALFCGGALVVMVSREIRSPLMSLVRMALILFAGSSITFLFANAWDHIWWLAHAIFAAGFFTLSFGVAQAWRHSGSFASMFSQDEMVIRMAKLQAAEQMARLDEERLREMLDTSPAGIAVTTAHGRVLFGNLRLQEMFGPASDQCAALLQHALAVGMNRRSIDEPGSEIPYRRPDGRTGWAIVSAAPFHYHGEAAAVVHVLDVTARKLAEQRLGEMRRES